jgi:hypothetical protein
MKVRAGEAVHDGQVAVKRAPMLNEKLTEREQRVLEHLQRAEELKLGLAQYARETGVAVNDIYSGKQALVRKGVIPGRVCRDEREDDEMAAGGFVAVHVAPRFGSGNFSACQIRHPSGVVVECSSLPPASWVTALLSGAGDVPA